jgi:hypothetical protein
MATEIPKAFLSAGHSAFALIDPVTESYRRVLDRHGAFRSGLKIHVAISYEPTAESLCFSGLN